MEITSREEFEEVVLNNKGKVIIDFYAVWCGPCRMIEPILQSIADENEDITVYRVNVDENQDLAMQFMVSSIPTLILMNEGNKVETLIGLRSKEDILEAFN